MTTDRPEEESSVPPAEKPGPSALPRYPRSPDQPAEPPWRPPFSQRREQGLAWAAWAVLACVAAAGAVLGLFAAFAADACMGMSESSGDSCERQVNAGVAVASLGPILVVAAAAVLIPAALSRHRTAWWIPLAGIALTVILVIVGWTIAGSATTP